MCKDCAIKGISCAYFFCCRTCPKPHDFPCQGTHNRVHCNRRESAYLLPKLSSDRLSSSLPWSSRSAISSQSEICHLLFLMIGAACVHSFHSPVLVGTLILISLPSSATAADRTSSTSSLPTSCRTAIVLCQPLHADYGCRYHSCCLPLFH